MRREAVEGVMQGEISMGDQQGMRNEEAIASAYLCRQSPVSYLLPLLVTEYPSLLPISA